MNSVLITAYPADSDPKAEAGCDEVDDDTVLIKDDRGHVIGFEKLNVSMAGEAQDVTIEVLKGPVRGR